MTPTAATGDAASTSVQLRERTAGQHTAAEQSPFQRQFVRGQLPQTAYIDWLGQMLLIYRRLEQHLLRAREADASTLDVAPWRRVPELEHDLAFWQRDAAAVVPVPATAAFLDQLDDWAARTPVALAGPLYVLEGSTNGARFIARGVRRAYGLEGREGTTFLDPYGEEQPERWATFKLVLDAAVPPDSAGPVVDAAAATFNAIAAIGGELLARAPASA